MPSTYAVSQCILSQFDKGNKATSTAKSSSGLPYINEYMMFFHITSDSGSGRLKITNVREMIDSLFTANFFKEAQNGRET